MSEAGFKDHFSGHAEQYAQSRPSYPDALFRFLADACSRNDRAWDCATGNGQAAVSLARYFAAVDASDASATQIAAAIPAPGVVYRVAPAEASRLEGNSIDLVTIAQALHWFDLDAFFAEAGRVLKPDGILAVWCYGTCTVNPACDALVHGLYAELDEYWPPERRLVENAYRDIELPGAALDCPPLTMQIEWSAEEMLAYLRSWSAVERHRKAAGSDPTASIAAPLRRAWGDARRTVRWPLTLKATRAGAC